MTDLAYDQATLFAHTLPDHADQLVFYTSAGVSRATAERLEERAARIQTIGRRAILDVGVELHEARKEAEYGTWGTFLKRCGLEERTAQNYMNVVEKFGAQPEMFSVLPASALYALAAPSANAQEVTALLGEVEAGARPTVAEIKERVAPTRSGAGAPPAAPPKRDAAPPAPVEEDEDDDDTGTTIMEMDVRPTTLAQPVAAPPALPPALTISSAAPAPALPPVLSIGSAAPAGDIAARKLLVAKLMLLREALALVEEELAATPGALVIIEQGRAQQAAQGFVTSSALNAAAAMLSFSATVEQAA